jgi:hypothetical protein
MKAKTVHRNFLDGGAELITKEHQAGGAVAEEALQPFSGTAFLL